MSEIEKMTSVFRFSNDPFGENGAIVPRVQTMKETLFLLYILSPGICMSDVMKAMTLVLNSI